jgi:hypothetical protein
LRCGHGRSPCRCAESVLSRFSKLRFHGPSLAWGARTTVPPRTSGLLPATGHRRCGYTI